MSVQVIFRPCDQMESNESIGDWLEVDRGYLDGAIKVRSYAARYFQRVVSFFWIASISRCI